ncbi:MAG TPA: hypothetical protein EYO58_07505 [Flavobacteriales bacterium]|nr:hypothetical protein [Flavobacteriales bacterium]
MESEQRYTEVERPFDYDETFLVSLRKLHKQLLIHIVRALEDNAPYLPKKDGWVQDVAGVIKGHDPYFFKIEYLHQEYETPLFLEIEEISTDEYLDYMIEDTILIDLEDDTYRI